MEFTAKEILFGLLGSGGFITGCILLFNAITTRLDARRKRHEDGEQKRLEEAVEIRRLELDYTGKGTDTLIESLWKLIGEKDKEIDDLKFDLDDCENAEKLTRPAVMKIYECVRKIRNEMDSLNIMLLSDEETNVFARRWGNIKVIMVELENTLAGSGNK